MYEWDISTQDVDRYKALYTDGYAMWDKFFAEGRNMDITKELSDLKNMYETSVDTLEQDEFTCLTELVGYMRMFIQVYDEHRSIRKKLIDLTNKMYPEQEEQ